MDVLLHESSRKSERVFSVHGYLSKYQLNHNQVIPIISNTIAIKPNLKSSLGTGHQNTKHASNHTIVQNSINIHIEPIVKKKCSKLVCSFISSYLVNLFFIISMYSCSFSIRIKFLFKF